MDFRKTIFALLSVLVLCLASMAHANVDQLQRMQTTIKKFLLTTVPLKKNETLSVSINHFNFPANLAICQSDIAANLPGDIQADQINSVELSCRQPNWHAYIPVNVKIMTRAVVAAHTIMPQQTIAENDLTYAYIDRNHVYGGFFRSADEVAGSYATQQIDMGIALNRRNVHAALLVHRDQPVDITGIKGAIHITMHGIAKNNGSLNDSVKVMNPSSKRVLDATVVGQNQVAIFL